MRTLPLACAVAFSAVGCGLAIGPSSACDFRNGSVNGPEPRCQERLNTVSAEAFKAACKAAGGVDSSGECPKSGAVGGCFLGNQGDGSKVNDWYYMPKTVDEVKKECSRDNATFLTP